MNRFVKIGLMGLAMTAALQSAAFAQYGSKVSRLVNELRSQGYRAVEVERTLMGRIKIDAKKGGVSREIIIDPNTGHVFRDRRENEGSHRSNGSSSNHNGSSHDDNGYDDNGYDDNGYDDGGSNSNDDHNGRDDHNDDHGGNDGDHGGHDDDHGGHDDD